MTAWIIWPEQPARIGQDRDRSLRIDQRAHRGKHVNDRLGTQPWDRGRARYAPPRQPATARAVPPPAADTRRDWVALGIAGLPGLAAIIALIFTAQSLQATDRQLAQGGQQVSISGQAEITDRFNAAVTNLSSSNTVIQLGGIYALQRIMTDSPTGSASSPGYFVRVYSISWSARNRGYSMSSKMP